MILQIFSVLFILFLLWKFQNYFIIAKEGHFDIEIYNSMGQRLMNKTEKGFEEIDFKNMANILEGLDEKQSGTFRAKNSSVKANMHTIQTIVETYGVDWGGYYAPNMAALHLDATTSKAGKYWKNQNNPYSGKSTKPSDWVIDYSEYKKEKSQAGMVLYAPKVPSKGRVASYWIYGVDHNGELIKDKGQVLTLSNS